MIVFLVKILKWYVSFELMFLAFFYEISHLGGIFMEVLLLVHALHVACI